MSILISCWSLLLLFAPRTKGLTVQGPAVPLSAQLGASVTLPCSVNTPLPLNELEVQWMRAESGTLVHLFQEGQSRPESQNPSYSSRAEFFTEEIPKGNFSLLLINVTTEDEGMYTCRVHTDQGSNETNVELAVERLVVTGASKPVFAYAGEDVVLTCSVDTHVPLQELQVEWEKTDEDILVLLFQGGQNIPESQHERFRDRAEFFTEEIPKGNFSLKLRGVRTEDRGEYMCKVHTDTDSVNATARLRELGFSSLHISVLVLSITAPIAAVALSVPALLGIIREDESKKSLTVCCLQVVVPCVMICVAFIMWGVVEGSLIESYTCSAVNLPRILMLFKLAPYLDQLPDKFSDICRKNGPIEHFFILVGVASAILKSFLKHSRLVPVDIAAATVIYLFFLLDLLSVFFCTGPNSHRYIFILQLLLNGLAILMLCGMFRIFSLGTFILHVIPLVGLITCILLKTRPRSLSWTKYGYLCQKTFAVGLSLPVIISGFLYMDLISDKTEDHAAWMCFAAFMYILALTTIFKHRSNVPAVPQICVYCFGAVGLPIVNCVALATELIQKANKGQRTMDLQLVVLPFESVFFTCWIVLQVYVYYMEKKEKIKAELTLIFLRGQTQSHDPTSPKIQISHENQEVPLSQPEHRPHVPDSPARDTEEQSDSDIPDY